MTNLSVSDIRDRMVILNVNEDLTSTTLKLLDIDLYNALYALLHTINYSPLYKHTAPSVLFVGLLILNKFYPNSIGKCVICENEYQLRYCSTKQSNRLSNVCSHSCELKRRHLDCSYTTNITTKSANTKSTTFIGEYNMHQIGSMKAVKTSLELYGKAGISNYLRIGLNNHHNINTHEPRKSRIRRMILYFGIRRLLKLYFRMNMCSYRSYITKIVKVRSYLDDYYQISYDELKSIYFEDIKNIPMIEACAYCSASFSRVIFISEFSYNIKNGVCCCKSCSSLYYMTDARKVSCSIRMKSRYADPNARIAVGVASKLAWTKRDSSIWVEKYLNTLGEAGIRRRTDAATQTKFDRGLISTINICDDEEYRDYRNDVISLTKALDLSNRENISKRGRDEYHLDHIFPISRGYAFNIPTKLIGHIDNVELMWHTDNRKKSARIINIPIHIQEYLIDNDLESYEKILHEIVKNK